MPTPYNRIWISGACVPDADVSGGLLEDDVPLIWRGPKLHSVSQQFSRQVDWGELDYLLIDLPPGTGDVQLSITQTVPLMGAIIVSTPQNVALQDARKAVMMFREVRVDVLGIVENMSYFECPKCGEHTAYCIHIKPRLENQPNFSGKQIATQT